MDRSCGNMICVAVALLGAWLTCKSSDEGIGRLKLKHETRSLWFSCYITLFMNLKYAFMSSHNHCYSKFVIDEFDVCIVYEILGDTMGYVMGKCAREEENHCTKNLISTSSR